MLVQYTPNYMIADYFMKADAAKVMTNGKTQVYQKDSKQFEQLILRFNQNLIGAYEMPAFGVSLDNETKQELLKGSWVEFVYNKPITHHDMTFDSLLIKIDNGVYGFNIIRGNQGKYEGRCYYVNLMKPLLMSLPKESK